MACMKSSMIYYSTYASKYEIYLLNRTYCVMVCTYVNRSINAVKEICNRCPLVMSEDLLRDLAAYKKSKNKSKCDA